MRDPRVSDSRRERGGWQAGPTERRLKREREGRRHVGPTGSGTRREGRGWWLGSASKPAGQAWRATAARAVAGDGNRRRGRRRQTARKAAAAAEDDDARAEDGDAHGRVGKREEGEFFTVVGRREWRRRRTTTTSDGRTTATGERSPGPPREQKWEGLEGEGWSTAGGNHGRRRRQWWYSPARGEKRAPTAGLDGDAAAGVALAAAKLTTAVDWLGSGSSGGERRPEEWKRRRRRV
jgi:hypothetical protein